MKFFSCNTAVVGAGAAGLNAADELMKMGVDALLIAPDLGAGTSRNAGSDKQTFFKLNVAGDYSDSPRGMAEAFFAGGAIHGDIAYALAAGSARAFFKLVELGVPFPQNELGEFVGYQTDHDASLRATSAGPLTSRYMAEKLLESVKARKTRILEGYTLVSVLRDRAGKFGGLLLFGADGPAVVAARNAILASGGPAGVYSRTVYPRSQSGATGAAIRAGVKTNNLCYWQYGLASLKVLWNVSGSYQQAIPAYRDEHGAGILDGAFESEGDRLDSIFRKGYQWPFDARKLNGSSRVDQQVLRLMARGGRAYLDFRQEELENPLQKIGKEAAQYLANCGANRKTPYGRLLAINPAAAAFYRDRGIDLEREALEIAVCAQHCNGGIGVDGWWRTSMDRLYAAGECAGVFGMYRPGGSALNETQVGSLRAAQHIAAHSGKQSAPAKEEFDAKVNLSEEIAFFRAAKEGKLAKLVAFAREARKRMDVCAGALRDPQAMRTLKADVEQALQADPQECGEHYALIDAIQARDDLYVMREALAAMLTQAQLRGDAGHGFTQREQMESAPDAANVCVETQNGQTRIVPVRALPKGGGWFETVWKDYLEGRVFGADDRQVNM